MPTLPEIRERYLPVMTALGQAIKRHWLVSVILTAMSALGAIDSIWNTQILSRVVAFLFSVRLGYASLAVFAYVVGMEAVVALDVWRSRRSERRVRHTAEELRAIDDVRGFWNTQGYDAKEGIYSLLDRRKDYLRMSDPYAWLLDLVLAELRSASTSLQEALAPDDPVSLDEVIRRTNAVWVGHVRVAGWANRCAVDMPGCTEKEGERYANWLGLNRDLSKKLEELKGRKAFIGKIQVWIQEDGAKFKQIQDWPHAVEPLNLPTSNPHT